MFCCADDIAVRFYEQDEEGNVKWEDYGNFAPHDVHRQVHVHSLWCSFVILYIFGEMFEVTLHNGMMEMATRAKLIFVFCCLYNWKSRSTSKHHRMEQFYKHLKQRYCIHNILFSLHLTISVRVRVRVGVLNATCRGLIKLNAPKSFSVRDRVPYTCLHGHDDRASNHGPRPAEEVLRRRGQRSKDLHVLPAADRSAISSSTKGWFAAFQWDIEKPSTLNHEIRFLDLEDIQKKRKKQIPNFGDSDPFSSSTTG